MTEEKWHGSDKKWNGSNHFCKEAVNFYAPVAEWIKVYKNDWSRSTFYRTLAISPLSCKRALSIRISHVGC